MRNKNILIIANHYITLYAFRKELIKNLLNDGYKVYISMPVIDEAKYFEELGCKLIHTPVDRHGINPVKDFKLFLLYNRYIKEINPSVVLTYTIKPNIYGGIASGLLNTPHIANITGGVATTMEDSNIIEKIALFLYRVGLKKTNCVFFQNEETRKKFVTSKIVNRNYKMIPGSGVNLKQHLFEEYPNYNNSIKFLFIGRITKDKGIDELIEAAIEIRERHPNAQFDAIGFYEEDYKDKIKILKETNIINFHGMQKDVRPFIKRCNAVVLPSYHEGMANALLEAASTGRPVLASDINGCKETFDEGISGFRFKPKSVDDLVDKLSKFIELPIEKKKEMGIAGRKKMEREFDRQIVIDAYINEIKEFL